MGVHCVTAMLSTLRTTLESPSRRLRDVLDLQKSVTSSRLIPTRDIFPTCSSQTLDLLSVTPGQFVSLLLTFEIFTWSLNRAPNRTIKYSDSDGRLLNFAFLLFSFYIWYSHWHIFGQVGSLRGDQVFFFLFSVKYVFGFSPKHVKLV